MPRAGAGARILAWTIGVGFVCFAAGFFGPIVLTPEANQGPLLGAQVQDVAPLPRS